MVNLEMCFSCLSPSIDSTDMYLVKNKDETDQQRNDSKEYNLL